MLRYLGVFRVSSAANEKENTQPFVSCPRNSHVPVAALPQTRLLLLSRMLLARRSLGANLSDCIRHLNHGMAGCLARSLLGCLFDWP